MYKILFTSALPLELGVVKKSINSLNLKLIKTNFFCIWMWNYQTILNLTGYLNKNSDFDFVINIWVCWYWKKENWAFQVWRILNKANDKELIIPCFISFWELCSILSSEKPVFNFDDLKWENFVDMESYWFELVLSKFQIPRIMIKVPVDKVWNETKNFDKEKALNFLLEKIDYEKLVNLIKKYLDNLPKKENLEKYFKHFNFTFSEKIIFEKLYFWYRVLVSEDFNSFFKENKKLEKKEFLGEMKWFSSSDIVPSYFDKEEKFKK